MSESVEGDAIAEKCFEVDKTARRCAENDARNPDSEPLGGRLSNQMHQTCSRGGLFTSGAGATHHFRILGRLIARQLKR